MNVTTTIKMDLTKPDLNLSVNAVQGDAYSRSLSIALYSGVHPWLIPEGITVAVRYVKPDRTKGYYDVLPDGTSAWNIQKNILTIQLAPQMLTVAGNVKIQIELIQDTYILSTFCLTVYVEANPAAGVLKSENYINWLQWIQDQSDKHTHLVLQSAQTAVQASQTAAAASEEAAISNSLANSAAMEATAANTSTSALRDETASIAAEVAAIVAGNEAYTKQESDLRYCSAIIHTRNGETITMSDSTTAPFQGLRILGKTIQNGTPHPTAPIPLQSAGNKGSIIIQVGASESESIYQTLSFSTPNNLPGIPTTSGGNYTDKNGQQWICDEVDFKKGVYIQRIGCIIIDGKYNNAITINDAGTTILVSLERSALSEFSPCICSACVTADNPDDYVNASICARTGHSGTYIYFKGFGTLENFNVYCASNPISLIYILASPSQIALSAAELNQYATLHTNYPNTMVLNNAQVEMEVKYVADTKLYIDKKFNELILASGQD